MALPVPAFYTTTGGALTTKDFGSVQAGAYKPAGSTGYEFRLYNAYGSTASDTMTSVKITIRDDDGGIDEIWVQQHWVQIKSDGGSTGLDDDAQTVYTAVGKNKELACGDIPSGEYRTLYARCYPPTDAEEDASIEFQLRATYQQPATSICKWITGLRGNGVVASTGNPFVMSTGGTTGTIPYEAGYALINNNEIYYGSSGSYDIETTGSGTYKIYLAESGSFNETTGSIASNELQLYEATISSGVCTDLDDKRVYLSGLQAGTTGAMPTTPDKGDLYVDITNGIIYGAKTSTGWTNIGSGTFLSLTDTPASYSGKSTRILAVTTGEDALEFATNAILESTGTADPCLCLKSTGHNVDVYLDVSAAHDHLIIEGQTTGQDTCLHVIAKDGKTGEIRMYSGTNYAEIEKGAADHFNIKNATSGANLVLGINYGGAKTITWDGSDGKLKHSGGTFLFDDHISLSTGQEYQVGGSKVKLDEWDTPTTGTTLDATTGVHGLLPVGDGDTTHYLAGDISWTSTTGIVLDSLATPTTGTALNATTGVHGLLPVGDGDTTHYLAGDISWTSTTGIVLDSLSTPTTGTALNASTGRHGLLIALDGTTGNYLRGDGSWQAPPGATGGEANTASNAGTTGIGIYYQKAGVDLEFKAIHSTGNILVTDSTGTITVNLDVISTGIKLDDLGTPDDNTDLNATTGHHGLLLKLTGSTSTYLNADGAWATPPGATGGATNFLQLTDTPANYTGDASKILVVTTGEDAVEFIPSTGILLDNLGTPEDNTDLNATTGLHGLLPKGDADTTHYLAGDISWVSTTGIVLDSLATPTTGTTLDATTGVHGLLPIRDGDAAHWLDGAGLWTAPTASEVGALESSGAFTVNAIPQITSTGGILKASVFAVTTGDTFNFGAHSAGFTEQAIAISTGATAIDWNNGLKALYTRSTGAAGAATFSFTAPVKSANLMLTIRGSTAGSTGTVTWPAIKWDGGSVPSLGSGASDINVVSFYYSTGLTSYLGQCSTGTFSS